MDSEQYALDDINFEADTPQKLADYYIIGQQCLNKVRSRYRTREALAPHWEAAEQAWNADPDTNPTVFPTGLITSQKLHDFYRKCDNLLKGINDNTSTPELIRAFFATNNGAMFLHSFLVPADHELSLKIARKAGDISEGTLTTPAQLQAILAGRDPNIPAEQVGPGDILRYTDIEDPNIVRAVLIKDHGSSAMRGGYFTVTTILDEEQDDGSGDREVPNDVMEEWVSRRVQEEL